MWVLVVFVRVVLRFRFVKDGVFIPYGMCVKL